MKLFLAALVLTFVGHAQAASVSSCKGLDSIGNLIGQTKSFSQGAIRVAHISTEEPAAAPDHVLVFTYGEAMSVNCVSIDAGPGQLGFANVALEKMKSKYDSKRGLLLEIPVFTADFENGTSKASIVKVRVNQRSEKITLE